MAAEVNIERKRDAEVVMELEEPVDQDQASAIPRCQLKCRLLSHTF
jgi:hypothetical protein